jgi:plasmid stabilization system protein ParE
MYKIVYEPEAEKDLVAILYYYAENGGIHVAEAIN